jgi:ATP synthase protein I
MAEEPFSDRLKRLEDRIAAARKARPEPRSHRGEYTQGSLAWRMVTELVAGMALGLGMGFGLDALFGTRPIFLVVFALFGFAAGVRVMLKTAEDVRRGSGEAALMRGAKEAQARGADAAAQSREVKAGDAQAGAQPRGTDKDRSPGSAADEGSDGD